MTAAERVAEPTCLAVDIGGTKIEVGVVAPDGSITQREQIRTNATAEDLFGDLSALIGRVRAGHDVDVVGVGCGGPMDLGGRLVSPLNIPAWRSFPLRAKIEQFTSLRTFVDNDAKALALAEGRFGAAIGVTDYLSMVVSTGVGGGLVLNNKLVEGRDGNAGHIGHVVVNPEGRLCPCGARGCLEAEASGLAIAAITGRPAAEASNEVRRRTGALVGQAVSSAAALLDFDRCFVAGSVALGFGDTFFDAANDAVSEWARISFAQSLRIEPSALGADGPLLGAASVAWRGLER
jgi:glucokinase